MKFPSNIPKYREDDICYVCHINKIDNVCLIKLLLIFLKILFNCGHAIVCIRCLKSGIYECPMCGLEI